MNSVTSAFAQLTPSPTCNMSVEPLATLAGQQQLWQYYTVRPLPAGRQCGRLETLRERAGALLWKGMAAARGWRSKQAWGRAY